MEYLLDTGVLLRMINRSDPMHAQVRRAVSKLQQQGQITVTTMQNISEFWNVCTRPGSARGGLGLSIEAAQQRLRLIERSAAVLPEAPGVYAEWKRLLIAHRILGVQVHDARIVAAMRVHGVTHLLTLNRADFTRYTGVNVVTPQEIAGVPPAVGRKGHDCVVIAPRRGVQTLLRRDASHSRPLRPIVRPLVFRQSLVCVSSSVG